MTADTPITDLQNAAAETAAEARASFTLEQALAGVKYRTRRVVIFRDEEAVESYATAERTVAMTEAALGNQDLTESDRADLNERLEEQQRRVEAAREDMLSTALSVHMRQVPDPVMDAGRRAARKAYAVDGVIPDERLEDANQLQQRYVLGRVIHKIVTSDGEELVLPRDEMAEMLQKALPFAQWQRIVTTYNEIVFRDAVALQATQDPGF